MAKNKKEDKKDKKKKEREEKQKKKEEEKQKKKRKDFLIKLKKEINKSTEFVCNYPTDEDIIKKELNFIWVGTPDGLIGTDECHYEILFYGNDTLKVEAHFEDDNFEDFQGIKLPNDLMYAKWKVKENNWRKDSRIIYRDKKGITGIASTVNKGSKIKKVMARLKVPLPLSFILGPKIKEVMDMLREFDGFIGAKLRLIVCVQRNYVILKVNDTHYKKYKILPIFSMVLFIAACVISVGAVIIKCCLSFNIVATVGLLMLAALLFVLSVIVRLRTDDERWIRFKLKNSVVDSMNGTILTEENRKILMNIMEL